MKIEIYNHTDESPINITDMVRDLFYGVCWKKGYSTSRLIHDKKTGCPIYVINISYDGFNISAVCRNYEIINTLNKSH